MMLLTEPNSKPQNAELLPEHGGQRDRAYLQLHHLLVRHRIPPGERLREPFWSARLGVSRAGLREALARLAVDGLIEEGRGGGYFVLQETDKDTDELVELRIILEGGAVERIVRLGLNKPANLERLADACDMFERLAEGKYAQGTLEADVRFHGLIVELSRNRRLQRIYRQTLLLQAHRPIVRSQQWSALAARIAGEHRAVLTAMREGDVATAQELLRAHLAEYPVLPHPEET
jgi:DNA-binding GntR family transcriptional regulator